MVDPHRFPREAWIPLLAGLFWLWNAPGHGLVGFLFSAIPGSLLLGAGVSMLLMPGDPRISHFAALGGVLGVLFSLPAFLAIGFLHGLWLMAVSAAGAVAAGLHSVRLEPATPGVPPADPSIALWAQVAVDEALLATMHTTIQLPSRDDHARSQHELAAAREFFESHGWLEKPADYHVAPPVLESPALHDAGFARMRYEHLSFESGYAPHPDEPGRERWLSYAANRTAHAWVVRSGDGSGPWLVCVHGYQMGAPLIDLGAFPPPWLHTRLGLNLLVPVLPLHGRRKIGWRSGDRFLAGDVMDTVHAEVNAMWDVRRLLGWVRAQGARAVGVMGYSLGGYNAALLASLDDDLVCAIAGIPVADFARVFYRHGPALHLREALAAGLDEERMREVLGVVSPLVLEPKVPHEGRFIFGAIADRLVPPDHVRDLWRHWGEPSVLWYPGAHVTFRAHPPVVRFINEALRGSGLALPRP